MVYDLGQSVALRQAFGPALLALAQADERICVVTADLGGSLNLTDFRKQFPDRYVNCGVAEADMIGISAGLAAEGYIPFAVTFGSFIGRTLDHVRQSVLHNKLKVVIVGSHGGISNAMDGPSAHAIEDIGFMRSMPGIAVVAPSCPNQMSTVLSEAIAYDGPMYLRLYREPLPVFTQPDDGFELGKVIRRNSGSDVTLLSYGPHVGFCLEWMDRLQAKASLDFFEVHTIRPLDEAGLLESVSRTNRVVTVEDHFSSGGLGSAVAELLALRHPAPMRIVGLQGFARTGPYTQLRDAVGLGPDDVERAISEVLRA